MDNLKKTESEIKTTIMLYLDKILLKFKSMKSTNDF